mmetsp:Transcript_37612/g.27727  ORF Transcript_37612/g.27727 Transcript_37612/m.27727 type:complete len:100 (+) Transcript_37612:242-541(+)
MAPKWFSKFRNRGFIMYMIATSALFLVYYNKLDLVQRRNDKNRITNLKSAIELEDIDFMKMVSDLNLEYDEQDLREIEKEFTTQLRRMESVKELQSLRS